MKTASFAMINFLRNSAEMILAELYTVTMATGAVYRWTDGPAPITFQGQTFSALGPIISRGRSKVTAKLEVATLDVTLKGQVLLGSTPITAAAANGALDGARVLVQTVPMATYGDTSLGAVVVFEGRVSGVRPSTTEVVLSLKSDLETLNTAWPRNLIQPGCTNQLFDAGCQVPRSAYLVNGTATGGTTSSVVAALGRPAGWFDLGVITFTSGALIGVQRAVKAWDGTTLTLGLPLPALPAGCAFQIVPGCDKTKGTCGAKFSNLARFRGCPYVPRPEAVR